MIMCACVCENWAATRASSLILKWLLSFSWCHNCGHSWRRLAGSCDRCWCGSSAQQHRLGGAAEPAWRRHGAGPGPSGAVYPARGARVSQSSFSSHCRHTEPCTDPTLTERCRTLGKQRGSAPPRSAGVVESRARHTSASHAATTNLSTAQRP